MKSIEIYVYETIKKTSVIMTMKKHTNAIKSEVKYTTTRNRLTFHAVKFKQFRDIKRALSTGHIRQLCELPRDPYNATVGYKRNSRIRAVCRGNRRLHFVT